MTIKKQAFCTNFKLNKALVSIDEDSGTLLSVCRLIPTPDDVDVMINDEQAKFISDELGIDMGDYRQFSSDVDTANEVIRLCFEIESEEILKSNDDTLSARGELATKLINTIHGPYENAVNKEEMEAVTAQAPLINSENQV